MYGKFYIHDIVFIFVLFSEIFRAQVYGWKNLMKTTVAKDKNIK